MQLKKDGTPKLNRNGVPVGSQPLKTHRQTMMISPEEVSAIDDFMFANRIASRAEAMRLLIAEALQARRVRAGEAQ